MSRSVFHRSASLFSLVLLCSAFCLGACINNGSKDARNDGSNYRSSRNFNRQPGKIHYSKHARCRMDCRDVSEAEVAQTLAQGEINWRKSQLDQPECRRRYALEAPTPHGQRVRIIFAPCGNETTVVTVIDLTREKDDPNCVCK